jgi:large subunit ribosomal protein L29
MSKESQRVASLLKEARGKKAADLNIDLIELRKAQFSLRLQRATGQAAKPDQFGKTRRDIARLKTVQRQLRAQNGEK